MKQEPQKAWFAKLLLASVSLFCLNSVSLKASVEEAEVFFKRSPLTQYQGLTLGGRRAQESEAVLFKKALLSSLHAREDITPLVTTLRSRLQALPQEAQSLIKLHFEGLLKQDQSLAPHTLLRSLHKLPSPHLTSTHASFVRLNEVMHHLKVLMEAPALKEVVSHLQELHDHYQNYQARLCQLNSHDQHHFFSAVPIKSHTLARPMVISKEMAYELLSMDEYGIVFKQNKQGSSPTANVGQVYSKRAVFITEETAEQDLLLKGKLKKKSLLDPAMESAIYAFHSRLFGEGIVPSTLLIFPHVDHREPAKTPEGQKVQTLLDNVNSPNLSAHDRRRDRNRFYEDEALKAHIVETKSSFAAQASLAIEGELLGDFLGKAQENPELFKTLDQGQVQRLLISLMLTNPNDAKDDNFMVTPGEKNREIIGIDNDLSFAARIITKQVSHEEEKLIHFPEVRNLLFMIPHFMDQPLLPEVRAHFLSHEPSLFLLQWLYDLETQNQRYQDFEANLGKEIFDLLRLPFKLQYGTLERLYQDMRGLQQELYAHPEATPQALLETLSPLLGLYYKKARYKTPDSLTLFKRIYNGSYEAQFSEMLKGETHLNNGQLIQEALQQEQAQEGAYRKRPQSIDEALKELLKSFDPLALSPQDLKNFLEELHQSFPLTLEQMFFKTPLLRLLEGNPSEELLDTFFMLFPERLEGIEEGQLVAPLHHAIKLNNPMLVSYLLQKGASPDQRTADHLYPLDLACDQKSESIFKILVEAEAYKVNADRALNFYHKLKPDSEAIPSFMRFARHHQELNWLLSLETLLPTAKEGVQIQTASLGQRMLPHSLFSQLFTEKGEVKPGNASGRHAVGSLTLVLNNLPLTLYFKAYPELPGLEEAVGEFTRRLLGFGTPYVELLRAGNFPILMSQGIQGFTLAHVLKEAPEILHHLDEEALSSLYLATMLVNPEDGKADNYIVQTLPTGKVRLIAIDNDHAFVPAVARQQKKSFLRTDPVVQVKSILYCLDHFQRPVSQAAREQILSINAGHMLERWLKFLRARNALYGELFTEQERVNLLKKDSYIGIPFQEGAITHLYRKIQRMQEALQQHSDITHQQLLKLLEPELAHRYSKGFERPASVLERFQLIDGPFYGKGSSGEPYTFTKSGHILKAMNIPLKESLLSLARQDSSKEKDFRPNKALEELRSIQDEHQQVALSKMGLLDAKQLKLFSNDQLSQALSQQDFFAMSLSDQRALLELIKGRRFEELILKNAKALTNRIFRSYPQLEALISLNLLGCKEINNSIIPLLASRAPHLIYLNLSNLPKLTHVSKAGWVNYDLLTFPALQTFIVNETNISVIYLEAPALKHLEAKKCLYLRPLKVKGNNLEKLIVSSSFNLSLDDIVDILLSHTDMQHLEMEGLPKIYFDPHLKAPVIDDSFLALFIQSWRGGSNKIKEAQGYYKKAILTNDADAQSSLAHAYAEGDGIEKNEQQAFKWAYKAAKQGHADAQVGVADMYRDGKGVEKDIKKAVFWFHKAAEQGIDVAQEIIAEMYLEGDGVEQDHKEALKWMTKAAEQGRPRVQAHLGWWYRDGKHGIQDNHKAMMWFQRAANNGNIDSQHNLGCMYRDGRGIERNKLKASKWFLKAAEQGSILSYAALGQLYYYGDIGERDEERAQAYFKESISQITEKKEPLEVDDYWALGVAHYHLQDFKQAFKFFQQGAEKGDLSQQVWIGEFYKEGLHVQRDLSLAFESFEKAAQAGIPAALYNLGLMYLEGEGITQDEAKAFELFYQAATLKHRDSGHMGDAQFALGLMYQEGRGVEKNLHKTEQWFEESKKHYSYHHALYSIGRIYDYGLGIDKDFERATFYYKKAAELNNILAKLRLASLASIVS